MIKKSVILLVYLFFCISICALAQSTYQVGILPSFTLSKKLNPKWKISANAQTRFSAYKGEFSNSDTFQKNANYVLTDISILVNRNIGLNTSLRVGYLTRFKNQEQHNRLIQQLIISKKYNSFALAHRFVTDQTFRPNEEAEFRLRYRLAFDRPLQGNKLNPKEFYLKLNNEYLIALQSQEWSNEIRLIPFLGYAFTDKNKLEIGIDYRVGSLGKTYLENNFWTTINYYLSF